MKKTKHISVKYPINHNKEDKLMSLYLAVFIFVTCFAIYGYFRLAGRLHSEPSDKKLGETSSGKLFRSKVHDAAFFDGESEDITEVQSRLRTYGGA
jgi:hypothetical protein